MWEEKRSNNKWFPTDLNFLFFLSLSLSIASVSFLSNFYDREIEEKTYNRMGLNANLYHLAIYACSNRMHFLGQPAILIAFVNQVKIAIQWFVST